MSACHAPSFGAILLAYPLQVPDGVMTPAMIDPWRLLAFSEWVKDGRPELDGSVIRVLEPRQ